MAIRIFSIMAYSNFWIKSGYKPAINRCKTLSHFDLFSDFNVNYRMAIRIFSIMVYSQLIAGYKPAYNHFGIKSGFKPAYSLSVFLPICRYV